MSAPSIRRALLVNVLAVFVVAWLLVAGATWLEARHEIEELFDAQLAQASGAIAAPALTRIAAPAADVVLDRAVFGHPYERKVSFQVWEGDTLRLRSQSAPATRLAAQPGFGDRELADGRWRVFARVSDDGRLTICIGESYAVREELIRNITMSALYPVLVLIPLVAVAVWFGIDKALAPLRAVAAEIDDREPESFEPLPFAAATVEIRPLTDAINAFLLRLRGAFERESRFTSDAAHELRTPLAAVKVQAQVARRARDESERTQALGKVLEGIDNCARLVEQMLTLARFESGAMQRGFAVLAVADLVEDALAKLVLPAGHRDVRFRVEVPGAAGAQALRIRGAADAIAVLLRNLLENAARHSPPGGEVRIAAAAAGEHVALEVSDQGPGIPEHERERVFERFYRGKAVGFGSGLGLSIVQRIAELHGASVRLGEGPGGSGLSVSVLFPREAVRPLP